jgi:hypothetical protein
MNTEILCGHWTLGYAYEMEASERPKTLDDMAYRWSDTKFCSYFDDAYINALQEFCLHLKPYGCTPRLYYDVSDYEQLWCIEFVPGTTTVRIGIYDYKKEGPQPPKTDEYAALQAFHEAQCAFKDTMMKIFPEREGWWFHKLGY